MDGHTGRQAGKVEIVSKRAELHHRMGTGRGGSRGLQGTIARGSLHEQTEQGLRFTIVTVATPAGGARILGYTKALECSLFAPIVTKQL